MIFVRNYWSVHKPLILGAWFSSCFNWAYRSHGIFLSFGRLNVTLELYFPMKKSQLLSWSSMTTAILLYIPIIYVIFMYIKPLNPIQVHGILIQIRTKCIESEEVIWYTTSVRNKDLEKSNFLYNSFSL